MAFAAVGLCAIAVIVMIIDAHAGLDLTDEGLYLLAADNHQPTAALNGWFGAYTGLLFAAVGYDIAWFRIAGMALLLAAGTLVGTGMLAVLEADQVVVPRPARIATLTGIALGQLIFYGSYLRTPGYNWLALLGALLAAAGLLRQVALQPGSRTPTTTIAGVLIGAGCFVAFWGKASAGLGLAGLALPVTLVPLGGSRRNRGYAGLVAAGTTVALLALHWIVIADPATTVAVLSRSLGNLASGDPVHYGPLSAVRQAGLALMAVPGSVVGITRGVVLLAVSPVILLAGRQWSRHLAVAALSVASIAAVAVVLGLFRAVPGSVVVPAGVVVILAVSLAVLQARRVRRWPLASTGLAMAAIAGVAIVLAVRGQWTGGMGTFGRLGHACLAVLAAAGVAAVTTWIVARTRGEATPSPRWRLAISAAILVGAAALYAFGSNNGIVRQMSGAGGLVLASAALVAVACVPRRWAARVLAGFSVGVAVVALVILGTARMSPYRTEPLADASTAITFGQRAAPLDVTPGAAAFWSTLQSTALKSGWRPGTRLLDLAWSPAVDYALGATVLDTLLSGQQTAFAIQAIRQSGGASWRDAWVLAFAEPNPKYPDLSPPQIMATVGRRFPVDYQMVVRLTEPWSDVTVELWRPIGP